MDVLAQLKSLFPDAGINTSPEVARAYAHDEGYGAPFVVPAAVARPTTEAEVAGIVKVCREHGVPVVARGAGTGLSGGANGVAGCVVISFERMNKILEIDRDERIAIVQPGVINGDLRRAVAEVGLFYPPDPASSDISTIGGNIGTNAGGLCCVKYGVTREYVLGLTVVLSTGEVVKIGRRTRKGVAGYDLAALFVGSEGTLGLVTEATLRLCSLPEDPQTVVGFFEDLEAAGRAVAAVVASGVQTSALELMDRQSLRAVDEWKGLGLLDCGNVLLLAQVDSPGTQKEVDADRILACFEAVGTSWAARSTNANESEALFAARKLVYPALKRHGKVISEDVCVPRVKLPEMLRTIGAIAERFNVLIANIAHAGDGNLHPMIVLPAGDGEKLAQGKAAMSAIVEAALAVGGTVTGEHGVGLLKKAGLALEVGPTVLEMHRNIKAAIDPTALFNPNKVFDL